MKNIFRGEKKGFKRGVASFYIVAFTTLILSVVATGFATVIVSEITRTENEDLSQSAYDSALAGVEDAKLAYSNYRRCRDNGAKAAASKPAGGGEVTCEDIMWWMANPDCWMVGHILGRIGKDAETEIMVNDTIESDSGKEVESQMNQAYTCVKILTQMDDYRAGLNSANTNRMIALNFDNVLKADGTALRADDIKKVRLSWYLNRDDVAPNFGDFINKSQVAFQPAKSVAVTAPPTVKFQMTQTAETFNLTDFDMTVDGATDRATLYFTPMNDAVGNEGTTFKKIYYQVDSNDRDMYANKVDADLVAKSNDRSIANKPLGTLCGDVNGGNPSKKLASEEFACSVDIYLPPAVGGNKSNETMMYAVALPYGQPDTEFSLAFYYDNDGVMTAASLRDAQVIIDSTGRANDLVRRVETRLETSNTSFDYPMLAIELLGTGNTLSKEMTVTREHNFYK